MSRNSGACLLRRVSRYHASWRRHRSIACWKPFSCSEVWKVTERNAKMPQFIAHQSRESEQQYLRLLKRRQRTSLWRERLASGAVLLALVCFIVAQGERSLVAVAWWLGIGWLLVALVLLVREALDAAHERRCRQERVLLKTRERSVP